MVSTALKAKELLLAKSVCIPRIAARKAAERRQVRQARQAVPNPQPNVPQMEHNIVFTSNIKGMQVPDEMGEEVRRHTMAFKRCRGQVPRYKTRRARYLGLGRASAAFAEIN